MLLAVQRLVKQYGTGRGWGPARPGAATAVRPAVQGVDLQLDRGDILALVGESGAGKSTLLRCILGLERPTSGRIVWSGRDISQASRSERKAMSRRIGAVFQDPYASLNPRLSIRQILEEPLLVHQVRDPSERRSRLHRCLSAVELAPAFLERRPAQLSGGERQRVALARALILEPALLLADEPTSALDLKNQERLVSLLESIHRDQGLAVLLVTHSIALAGRLSRRVAVMLQGRIVEEGETRQVLEHPQADYSRQLVRASLREL